MTSLPQPSLPYDDTRRPGVVRWFYVYAAGMALLYLLVAAFGTAMALWPERFDETHPTPSLITGLMFAILGSLLMLLFAVAPFLPRRKWVWIYHLVLIALGLTSCCILPASIPLLIFWIRPATRMWYTFD